MRSLCSLSSLSSPSLLTVLSLLSLLPCSLLSSPQCPGFYPDPQACDQFYQCDSHKSYLFHCPAGTLFDVDLGVCNHQYLVKCLHTSPAPPTTRPETVRPSPAPLAPVATDSADTITVTLTDTDLTTQTPPSSSDSLINDNDNIFLDLSKPSTTASPPVSTAEEMTSCSQFYVCKEVAPGLLSADRIFSCPDRYLFDPETRLCQRESKVSCDLEETPNLFYSGLNLFVVKLTEEDLDTFFSQDLRLAREKSANRYNIPLLPYYQHHHQPLQWFYPGLALPVKLKL